MASQDHAPHIGSVTSGQPDAIGDTCPLCGDPARIRLDDTEDGPEWVGQCVRCNTLWEMFL